MKVEPCCKSVSVGNRLLAKNVIEEGVYSFENAKNYWLLVFTNGSIVHRLVYSIHYGSVAPLNGLRDEEVMKTNKKLCMELKD